ncbi:type II secretion system protein GspM, partial [Klebsiella pneumoniae]
MPMPSARRDRWLALALLLAVLGLAYLLLVHPWFTQPLREIDADVAALREREQRVQAQLQQQPQIEQRLRAPREALQQRPGFLREATAEAAAAALGAKLQDAVAMASPGNRSCTISNRTPLTDNRRDAEFVRVAMQVRLRCGVAELATVLHSLETGSPRLFVDNLNLIAQRFQQSPNESGLGL